MKKRSLLIILLVFFLFLPSKVNAATTFGDLLDELEELKIQKKEEEEQKAISEAEFKKTTEEMAEREELIKEYNLKIDESTKKIAELEIEILDKKEETDNILVFLQLSSGEKSYLEYIFKATSFTDFIHRISVVEQLSKYNSEQIDIMNDLITQNNLLKEELKENIKKEEAEREKLKEELKKISSRLDELDEHTTTIDEKIEDKEKIIETYRNGGCTERSDRLSTCLAIPRATGFKRPFAKGVLTSKYGYRKDPGNKNVTKFHNGVDLSDSSPAEGKAIYPVAAGVISATGRWGCGGNYMFIYHNINGRKYTSVYLHLLSYGNVKVNDVVTEDTIIGYMGGYSTSTYYFPKTGYDTCSYGAHLHLAISTGHRDASTYRSYLVDPATVIYFPSSFWYSRTW